MYATLLSMQQDDIVTGLEALTNKAKEIVLGKSSTVENPNPSASQSGNDPLAMNHSLPDLPNNETIIPPAAASNATTPMLF
jgi:hypothetical protein